MRIRRLQVRDLRRYRDLDVAFSNGLTVVRGPNEAGKTTIQRAVELVLTKRVTSNAGDLEAMRPWDAPDDARPVVTLEFEQDDEEGTKEGFVEKAFRGSRGAVRLEFDGEIVTDPSRADEVLADLTGIPSEAFFRSTASVRHHELSDLARDEAALRDRLQASISGADRGTSRAKRTLDRALRDLNTRGPKNPGRLKQAEDAVADTETKLQAGEDSLGRLERDRDALAEARGQRADAEATLGERRSMLEKARTAERLVGERDAAQERYERFRSAVEVRDSIAAMEQAHPSGNPLPVLRQSVERLRKLDQRIRELQAALSGEVEVQFEVPPEVRWRPLSQLAIVFVLLGLVISGATYAAQAAAVLDVGIAPILLGGALAGIGFILAFIAWWLRRHDRIQQQLREVEVDRRLRGRSEMEQELKQAETDSQQQLMGLGLSGLAAADDLLMREEAHTASIARERARLEGLIGNEQLDALPKVRDGAALEIERKTQALEELGPIAKEPRARERLEVEVADLERALERARDDEANARARVEQNPIDAEEVAALAERLAMWGEELEGLRRKARVIELTLRAMEQAEQATMQRATRFLERGMVQDVDRISGGRYKRVKVDDADLGISVWAPERGGWVPVSELSQGTLDLVYLAARLGLVRLVTGDRRPPLILDDPFVTLDDQRAARALVLLRELADDFQVIYLTTSDRYDRAADLIVELPGPTAVDDLKAPPAEVAAHA